LSTDLFKQINKVKDRNNMTVLEKKHEPIIECPDTVKYNQPFEVKISWGKEVAHPDEPGHFIEWLELYTEDHLFLGRVDFTPMVCTGPVTLTVKLPHVTTLVAQLRCNLHGIWESSKNINVED